IRQTTVGGTVAVAAGFEPARGLPPYTLSRRAPSSARAGHRDDSTEARDASSPAAGSAEHGVGGSVDLVEDRDARIEDQLVDAGVLVGLHPIAEVLRAACRPLRDRLHPVRQVPVVGAKVPQ